MTRVRDAQQLPVTLTVDEVAEILGISRNLAYKLAKRQDFPAARVGDRRLVVPREELFSWLVRQSQGPPDQGNKEGIDGK